MPPAAGQYTAGELRVNRRKARPQRVRSRVNRQILGCHRGVERSKLNCTIDFLEFSMASSRSFPTVCARFGRFELDLNSRELSARASGSPSRTNRCKYYGYCWRPRAGCFARTDRSALWPEDTFVDFEHGVNTAIKKLRQALEDSAECPQYVETLPRVGYRFLVTVEWLEDASVSRKPLTVVTMPSPTPEPPSEIAAQSRTEAYALEISGASAQHWPWRCSWCGSSIGHRDPLWRTWGFTLHRAGVSNRQAAMHGHQTAPPDRQSGRGSGKQRSHFSRWEVPRLFRFERFVSETRGFGRDAPASLPAAFTPTVESWFPDSVHLVVSWIEDSKKPPGLWVISVLGGSPRKLTDVGSFARVSPDGSQIAFLRGPWDDNEIWLMDSNGNEVRKLVDAGMDYFGPVAWSPDGQRFATVRASVERPESQIQVYETRTGRAESILSIAGLGPDILWTAPGKLFYSQVEAPPNQDNSNIWSVQLTDRTGRQSARRPITDDRDRVGSITASSDGKRMATIRYSYQGDIFLTTIEQSG